VAAWCHTWASFFIRAQSSRPIQTGPIVSVLTYQVRSPSKQSPCWPTSAKRSYIHRWRYPSTKSTNLRTSSFASHGSTEFYENFFIKDPMKTKTNQPRVMREFLRQGSSRERICQPTGPGPISSVAITRPVDERFPAVKWKFSSLSGTPARPPASSTRSSDKIAEAPPVPALLAMIRDSPVCSSVWRFF
jgi:hypothetical protein